MTFNRITPGDMGANYLLVLGAKIVIVAIMILIVRAKRPTLIKNRKLKKEITRLEDEMYRYAKNLEFEEAAAYRDRVEDLKLKLISS